MVSILIMGLIGVVLLFLINKSVRNGLLKICLSVAVVHHFLLHGVMQRYVNENMPGLVESLNGIPFSLGSTILVTIGIYFTVLFFLRRR